MAPYAIEVPLWLSGQCPKQVPLEDTLRVVLKLAEDERAKNYIGVFTVICDMQDDFDVNTSNPPLCDAFGRAMTRLDDLLRKDYRMEPSKLIQAGYEHRSLQDMRQYVRFVLGG